jgi:hypothetical protein
VGLVAVVRMDHWMDWRLSNHFLPQASSLALKLLYFLDDKVLFLLRLFPGLLLHGVCLRAHSYVVLNHLPGNVGHI